MFVIFVPKCKYFHVLLRNYTCTIKYKLLKGFYNFFRYNNKRTLELHITAHGDVRRYVCNLCGYKSKFRTGLHVSSFFSPFSFIVVALTILRPSIKYLYLPLLSSQIKGGFKKYHVFFCHKNCGIFIEFG